MSRWSKNPWLRAVRGSRKAQLGIVVVGFFLFLSLFGDFLVQDPRAYLGVPHSPPSLDHWLGLNGQGQDALAQTVIGTRASLWLGVFVGGSVVLIGTLVGVAAGYFGGWIDSALSLLVNVLLVIPGLPLAVIIAAFLPAGLATIAIVLIVTGWAWNARVMRAQSMTLRGKDFVLAAKVAGESDLYIIVREIIPNMISLMASQFIGGTVYAIGAQVGLEFLGLGDVSAITWGTNLYWATNDQALLTGSWWTFVPTGLCLAGLGFGLTLINFAVDEVTNPNLASERTWRTHLKRHGRRVEGSTPVLRDKPVTASPERRAG